MYSVRRYNFLCKQCVFMAVYTIHCDCCLCVGPACTEIVGCNKDSMVHGTCIKIDNKIVSSFRQHKNVIFSI